MLSDAQQYLFRTPWPGIFPGIALALICLGFNLFGDALRDAPAVRGASLALAPGERIAVVGQSGSGKSTVAHAGEKRLRRLRGREVGLVPQDPMTNLNPVSRVGRQVAETLVAHGMCTRRHAWTQAVDLLGQAGLTEPARRARGARVLSAPAEDYTRRLLDAVPGASVFAESAS